MKRIKLTKEQEEELHDLVKKARLEFSQGKPGMIMAQYNEATREMMVAFVPYDIAKYLQAIMEVGTNGALQKTWENHE